MNDPEEDKRRMIEDRDANGEDHISLNEGAIFIEALRRLEWKEENGFLYSPSGGLNFPVPEGWLGTFNGLKEIMNRRIKRAEDPDQLSDMSEADRTTWMKEHVEVLKAIKEAEDK